MLVTTGLPVLCLPCLLLVPINQGSAHDWHSRATEHSAGCNGTQLTAVNATKDTPAIAAHFQHFKNVSVRWDGDLL